MALWLAHADREGMTLTLQVADATTADLGDASFELVIVLYLHLPRTDMAGVVRRCQRAVITGGTLLVLGHDRDNVQRGTGGPEDPDLLYDTDLLHPGPGWEVVQLEQVDRHTDSGTAIDTLLLGTRLAALRSAFAKPAGHEDGRVVVHVTKSEPTRRPTLRPERPSWQVGVGWRAGSTTAGPTFAGEPTSYRRP